jgi:small subunit ribosomal protein S16
VVKTYGRYGYCQTDIGLTLDPRQEGPPIGRPFGVSGSCNPLHCRRNTSDGGRVAVKIRLARHGSKKNPIYRVVVADSRVPRDGRAIEEIGRYNPQHQPSLIEIDADRAREWLSKGAQPTATVRKLLTIAGV